jgi:excisionase family DNA binding protein
MEPEGGHEMGLEPLNSVNEAARKLNVSPHTIKAWLKEGRLQRTRLGRRVMVRESELARFADAGTEERIEVGA